MTDNLEQNMALDTPSVAGLQEGHYPTDNPDFVREVLRDYETCLISREVSLLGRREVLTGKAKFGIFGDGKELPQVAMARTFKKGDWRAGYYRDQTLMFALGIATPESFFAQLYADSVNDPFSGGRQMNAHFATPSVDKLTGEWTDHRTQYNQSSDISSTAGQMARAVGLALASKKYREVEALRYGTPFSNNGDEVCFCTIGDASTSEGVFWEAINAAGVMRIPLAVFVWDDGYGISVPAKYQTTKSNISAVLQGFAPDETHEGVEIYTCNAWDYPEMCQVFEKGIAKIRKTHTPAIFHVKEVTQPQGHSTSGSHERYKSKERLEWEQKMDCIAVMRRWIVSTGMASEATLEAIELSAKAQVREGKTLAWNKYFKPLDVVKSQLETILTELAQAHPQEQSEIETILKKVKGYKEPYLSEIVKNARRLVFLLSDSQSAPLTALHQWIETQKETMHEAYSANLHSETPNNALKVPVIPPVYAADAPVKNGYEIINSFFDQVFEKYNNTFAFGEDVGHIGDVNQGFMGLQAKYGIERIFDVGIREWTIIGQAIGMAMRGLRPIAEIQYLDYIYYGLAPLADDLTTLRYRSDGIQQAPAIIRTRGHRLEGIWHAGSPMGMMIHALRGMYICVPRNFVQAAGMYNTLLQSNDPAIVVESLNGYRLKERLPDNIGTFTVPLGVPDVLVEGRDVTLVTYGSCVRIAEEAVAKLATKGIFVTLIDVQTLLPFDINHTIVQSLAQTNRIVFLDEDVPGGATAFMMQEVLEKQGGYRYLDCAPRTITAKEHRPPYGSDGDYFAKPNVEDVCEAILDLITE